MNCDITSVDWPGPPWVMTRIRSKILKELIVSITVTKNVVGRRHGIVTLPEPLPHAGAVDAGRLVQLAGNGLQAREEQDHVVAHVSPGAHDDRPRASTTGRGDGQPGGFWMPTNRRNSLIGPYCGLNSRFHTDAMATIEVM